MAELAVLVDGRHAAILRRYRRRVEHLFGVDVNISDGHGDEDGEASVVSVRLSGTRVSPISGELCVTLLSRNTKASCIDHAKEYVTSLTLDDEESCHMCGPFPLDIFTSLFDEYDSIERRSRAVIKFYPESHSVSLCGQEMNVTLAKLLLDQKVSEASHRLADREAFSCGQDRRAPVCVVQLSSDGSSLSVKPKHNSHKVVSKSFSPGWESHDSCYDSDGSPSSSRRNSSCRFADSHTDISRVDSDTLRLEHTESPPVESFVNLNKDMKNDATGVLEHSDYKAKVEFALKLGYSEADFQIALKTLGVQATQNELLGELIRLGSSTESDTHETATDEPCPSDQAVIRQRGTSADSRITIRRSETRVIEDKLDTVSISDDIKASSSLEKSNLRPIVIDGSNVAMSHGNKEVFSCQGIKLAVDWFKQRGHREITVFVPQWRKEATRPDAPITDQNVLLDLEKEKILVFTPARRVAGKRVICYDDRFVIKLAAEIDGIVVSNDNYRDLINEDPGFKKVIEERLLMYSFVKDRFMPPEDPLGRHGPKLDNFLRVEPTIPESLPPPCPYGKKCTYGNKCKYHHPERGSKPHKMVSERLAEQAKIKIQEIKDRSSHSTDGSTDSSSSSFSSDSSAGVVKKTALGRTKSLTPGQKMPLSRTKSGPPESTAIGEDKPSPKSKVCVTASDASVNSVMEAADLLSLNQVSVSSESEFEKWKNYNNLLSAHRKRIERAEAQQDNNVSPGQESSKQITVRFGKDSKPETLGDTSTIRSHLPSWSSVEPDKLLVPQSEYKATYGSGHLALAKKLSDERDESVSETDQKSDQGAVRARSVMVATDTAGGNNTSTGGQSEKKAHRRDDASQNSHRKLNRQLSLKGEEDPRWIQKQISQQGYVAVRPSVGDNQHGYAAIHPSIKDNRSNQSYPSGKTINSFREQQMIARQSNLQPADQQRVTGYSLEVPSYHDRSAGGDHVEVTRMSSAPVTYTYRSEGPQVMPSRRTQLMRMTRENSSSDTQLHLLGDVEKSKMGSAAGAGGGSWSANIPESEENVFHQVQMPMGMVSMAGSQQQPINSQYFAAAQPVHYLPQSVPYQPPQYQAFIGNTAVPAFTNMTAMPGVQQTQLGPLAHMMGPPPGGGMQRSGSPVSISSLVMPPPNMHYMMQAGVTSMHRSVSPSLSAPQQQNIPQSAEYLIRETGVSMVQRSSSPMEGHHQQQQQQQQQPHMIGPPPSHPMVPPSQPQPVLPPSQTVLESFVRHPPLPQESFTQEAMIHPTDPRYPLYYHLCGLFPEDKVRCVMNQHPNETNPQLLCAYIIGMKLN